MKIVCTVNEFAEIVRGCHDIAQNAHCFGNCPLCGVCGDGNIEQFVSAKDISDDAEVENEKV